MSNANNSTTVSIVVPHFNRTAVLKEAIQSVEAQTYTNWEMIIVDDGSTESERQALEQFATERIHILDRIEEPKGHTKSRNIGMHASRGEYIIFLDSDDQLAPWCLEQRIKQAQAEPTMDFWVFPVMLFTEEPMDSACLWNQLEGTGDLERFLRSDCPWQTTSTFWKKQPLLNIGGFNDKIFYGADSDIHTRALASGLAYKKFPACLPDTFIRRSEMSRITNTVSERMLNARRVRLSEATKFLKKNHAEPAQLAIWEGQYFFEFEFLLYNVPNCQDHIKKVYEDWKREYHPLLLNRFLVNSYLTVALRCKTKAYIIVRIARRIVIKLLPTNFFPKSGGFESAQLPAEQCAKLRTLLSQSPVPDSDI